MEATFLKTGSKKYQDFSVLLVDRPTNIKKQSLKKKYYEIEVQTFKKRNNYYRILKENVKRGYFPCVFIEDLYRYYNNCSYHYFFLFIKKVYSKYPLFFIYRQSNKIIRRIPTHIFKSHISIWVDKPLKEVLKKTDNNLQTSCQYSVYEKNESFC